MTDLETVKKMETKAKYYVNPSSLGSYFGVGFNTPKAQFEIDRDLSSASFDEDALERMELGKFLENPAMDFFEWKFGIKIDGRNVDTVWLYDGKIKAKVDGKTELFGKKTVVENKISNSNAYKFTENNGYLIQCQSYMIDGDYEQALLCGLYKGKPTFKIIPRDEEVIADIKEMTDFVVSALMGITDFDEGFPQHLYDKYSGMGVTYRHTDVDTDIRNYWAELSALKDKEDALKKEFGALKKKYADAIEKEESLQDGVYKDDFIEVRMNTITRGTGIDVDALSVDHPDLDLSKYMRTTTYRTTKVKSMI